MVQTELDRAYDELLVTQSLRGDRAALNKLAARWHPRLLRTARRLLGQDEQARDVAQEAWIGIHKGLGRLNDPRKFPVWAYKILHNKCNDRIKAEIKRRGRESQIDYDIASPAKAETLTAIHQAFATLTPTHRIAATLFYSEGLTVFEIAAITNVPLGTAKSRLFHARKQLKSLLKGDDNDTI